MGIRGNLGLIVLKLLSSKELTGFGLIREIEKETGFWKPSAGSVYPLLYELRLNGFLDIRIHDGRKYYSLNDKGRLLLHELEAKKSKVIDELVDGLRFYRTLTSQKEEISYIIGILKGLGKRESEIIALRPEIINLREKLAKTLPKLNSNGKAILKDASKRLKLEVR